MINLEDYDFNRMDSYVFKSDIEDIPINKIVILDKSNINQLDKIIISNYGNRDRDYFKNIFALVCYFNNIQDVYNIKIGQSIKLPDIESLLLNFEEILLFDDEELETSDIIPGINMKSELVQNKNKNSSSNNITTANPKLNISVKSVTYDKETGKLTY